MASIIGFPTEKDRWLAELGKRLQARGLSLDHAIEWCEADIKPRLEKLGLPYDSGNPIVKQLTALEFELYCEKHGVPCDPIILD